MKKLITIIMVLFMHQLFGQTTLSTEQTMDLLTKTNYMYCQSLDAVIRCMFEYDEAKFTGALDSIKLAIKNYDKIEKNGTFNNQGRLAKQRGEANKWTALSLFFDKAEYKNGERKKKVTYAGMDRKIPKNLKKQFEKLVEIQTNVCLSNLF